MTKLWANVAPVFFFLDFGGQNLFQNLLFLTHQKILFKTKMQSGITFHESLISQCCTERSLYSTASPIHYVLFVPNLLAEVTSESAKLDLSIASKNRTMHACSVAKIDQQMLAFNILYSHYDCIMNKKVFDVWEECIYRLDLFIKFTF
jgi:hypothetical protein